MTFVYPLLLGGLLLAGVPVLLHFLVRQKPKLLPFPAFRFLMQKRRTNTRNLRLRHLLLLLLRIALLVLLCLALARPRLLHDLPGILSRERPVAMILVFDTSASMEYKSGDLTRLDLAKKRGLELLEQLPEDCRLLILDSSADFGRADWLKTLDQARQRINSLTIRPDSTPVTKALDEAHRRFDEWDDPMADRIPRFICVFSDRTAASWGVLARAKQPAKEDAPKVQTLYFDVGIDDPIDLAITQVELPAFYLGGRQQSFGKGETIELRAVVKATGKDTESTLSCKIGDRELIGQHCPVKAGEQRSFKFEIDTMKMQLEPGFHQAEVAFDTKVDALPFNNKRFVTFEIRKMPKILVLADDPKKALVFVKALKAWVYTVDVRSVQNPPALDEYSAVFLDGVSDPQEKLWKALDAYVQQGGGVGIIPGGDGMKLIDYNSDEAKKVMPAEIMTKVKATPGQAWNIQLGDLDHPFFRRFQSWFVEDFDISKYPRRVQQYWKVKPTEKSNVVVRYDDSSPAIVERLFPKGGKVLLLTTPMEDATPPWNDYYRTQDSFYLALTMLCTHYLCPESENPVWNYQFGATPPRMESKQRYQKYLLTGPSAAEEITFDDNGFWVGARLPSAGNYVILGVNDDKQEPIAKFSINVPGAESDLTHVPISDIEAMLGKDSLVPQDRKTSLPQTLNWDEPMELFPWLMLLFLFILALENLLANKFYRQEPATP